MKHAHQILNILLDIYEKRGLYADESGRRAVSLSIEKVFPAYADRYDLFIELNTAIDCLVRNRFVCAQKDPSGYYKKVTLRLDLVAGCYREVGRTPVGLVREQLRRQLSEVSGSHPIVLAFQQSQLARIASAHPLAHGIGDDPKKLKDVLTALIALTELGQETDLQRFSQAIFSDCNRFFQIQSCIVSILCTHTEEGLTKANALETFNLLASPGYIYLKGQFVLAFQNSALSVCDIPGGVALPSRAIPAIRSVRVCSQGLTSVESLAAYHSEPDEQAAVLCLGGYQNAIRTELLQLIYRDNPDKRYDHKGSIDAQGFLALESLREKTGIPFQPKEMDLQALRQRAAHGLAMPLTAADRKLLDSPKLAGYAEVLAYMKQNNCKARQETGGAVPLPV